MSDRGRRSDPSTSRSVRPTTTPQDQERRRGVLGDTGRFHHGQPVGPLRRPGIMRSNCSTVMRAGTPLLSALIVTACTASSHSQPQPQGPRVVTSPPPSGSPPSTRAASDAPVCAMHSPRGQSVARPTWGVARDDRSEHQATQHRPGRVSLACQRRPHGPLHHRGQPQHSCRSCSAESTTAADRLGPGGVSPIRC